MEEEGTKSPTSEARPAFLRIPEFARLCGISTSQAYTLISRGEIPVARFGHAMRVPFAAVERKVRQALGE